MRQLAAFFFSLLLSTSAASQASTFTPTPPGEVLRTACSKVNAPGSSPRDMLDRAYCLRFIEGALTHDRALFMADQRRIAEASRAGNADPLSLFPGPRLFCVTYDSIGVHSLHVADVATGLANYLSRLPSTDLDRLEPGDDVQMRLLIQYLKVKHPCVR